MACAREGEAEKQFSFGCEVERRFVERGAAPARLGRRGGGGHFSSFVPTSTWPINQRGQSISFLFLNMSAAKEHPPMIYRRLGRTGLKASSLRDRNRERERKRERA